jgi:putative tricarboxylic transport membrane protein
MTEFLQYFPLALTSTNILTLILGVIGGLILGATPGLSPTMAVALLVPFTVHMNPTTGLVLLGAVYTATVAGGAISAILINIPGAPPILPPYWTVIPWPNRENPKKPCICVLSAP